jgi:hypothetical protein
MPLRDTQFIFIIHIIEFLKLLKEIKNIEEKKDVIHMFSNIITVYIFFRGGEDLMLENV